MQPIIGLGERDVNNVANHICALLFFLSVSLCNYQFVEFFLNSFKRNAYCVFCCKNTVGPATFETKKTDLVWQIHNIVL